MAFTITVSGCSVSELTPVEYVKWVRDADNGLIKRKDLEPFYFEVLYRPHDFQALAGSDLSQLGQAEFEQRHKEVGGVIHMEIRLGALDGTDFLKTGITDMSEYYGRLEYFTGSVQKDLQLIQGKDTLACVLHHFERSYGIRPYNSLMVGFEGEEVAVDHTLIFRDRALGVGPIRFKFEEGALSRLPRLTFKT